MREGRLWEWVGVDRFGNAQRYQTETSHHYTEARALENLRVHFPNLTITSIEEVFQPKPAVGIVQSHTFTRGYYDAAMREMGFKIRGVDPEPVVREVWREDMRRQLVKRPPLIIRPSVR